MVVHFPLALVVTAAALLLAARLVPRDSHAGILATVGTWNLCLGALAALFALGTGLVGVIDLHVGPDARRSISMHAAWALFTSLSLLLLAVWRGAGNGLASRPSWLLLIILLATTGALIFTGYRGGQNVYRYGVGVSQVRAAQ
jgi:uncharacterized membrane protein